MSQNNNINTTLMSQINQLILLRSKATNNFIERLTEAKRSRQITPKQFDIVLDLLFKLNAESTPDFKEGAK